MNREQMNRDASRFYQLPPEISGHQFPITNYLPKFRDTNFQNCLYLIMSSIVIDSPIGFIEIIGTEEFISSAMFFDKPPTPSADSTPKLLFKAANQFQEYFSGTRKEFDLPLQQTGTEFQQKVWNELCKIPFGETISYMDLAKRLGDVKCIRAAGTANGKNKISIIVPCHRVIGTDGSLTGYAGGLFRKDFLLRHEGGWPNTNQISLFE